MNYVADFDLDFFFDELNSESPKRFRKSLLTFFSADNERKGTEDLSLGIYGGEGQQAFVSLRRQLTAVPDFK